MNVKYFADIRQGNRQLPVSPRWSHICFSVLLVLVLSSCSHKQLTPITAESTGYRNPGQIIWHDLITDDVEAAKTFYGELLGWSFQQHGDYTVVLNDSTPIGGMVYLKDKGGERRSAGWLPYVSIPDVDETARWVQSAGGKILKGPGDMANRGRYATIIDPVRSPIVLLHSKNGDPHKANIRLGDWLWDELWATDVEAALDFYQDLGGYAAKQADSENDTPYWILLDENGKYQGGITEIPFEELPSQWVPVVRVEEPKDVILRVASLGGDVVIHPDHPLSDGTVALIRDPTGGIFMVESWESGN